LRQEQCVEKGPFGFYKNNIQIYRILYVSSSFVMVKETLASKWKPKKIWGFQLYEKKFQMESLSLHLMCCDFASLTEYVCVCVCVCVRARVMRAWDSTSMLSVP
jgi:hypothetical protein